MISKQKTFWMAGGLAVILIAVTGAVFAWPKYVQRQSEKTADALQVDVPKPIENPVSEMTVEPTINITEPVAVKSVPTELNLDVPFTTQAPTANWDAEHEELCEEASALMAHRYFTNQPIANAADAEAGMQVLSDWETKQFGTMKSTTAKQTAEMIRSNYQLTVEFKSNPTVDDIKRALSENKLVLVPAAGQLLKNPYFKQPGPVYHMLVIKGYTKTGNIITNDPGTKHGADYVYEPATLLNAIGDWNDGDPAHGQKIVLIVSTI